MILVDIINEYGYEDVAFLKRLLAFMKTYVGVFEAIAERHPSDPQEGTKK